MPSIISTPGKTGFSGKMAEELRFVEGHVLDADRVLVAAHVDDAIDHEERIAMRQRLEDVLMSAASSVVAASFIEISLLLAVGSALAGRSQRERAAAS